MNKNQKRVRAMLTKKGNVDGVAIETPSHGYHNDTKGRWTTRRIAPVGGKTVYRAKSKPFPKPNGDGMTLSEQRRIFLGSSFIS